MTDRQFAVRDAEIAVAESEAAVTLALAELKYRQEQSQAKLQGQLAELQHDVVVARTQLMRDKANLEVARAKQEKGFD